MRTLNSTIMAQLAAKTLRPFLILDMSIDGTNYRYTDCDVPIGVRYKYEAITGGPTVHGLSLADGVAYVRLNGLDLSPFAGVAGVRTPCKLILTDSAAKQAIGWIAEADAAETLSGSELLSNPGYETLTSGSDDDGTSDNFANWLEINDDANGDKSEATATAHAPSSRAVKLTRGTGTTASVRQFGSATPGKLYKVSFWARGASGVAGRFRITDDVNTLVAVSTTGVTGDTYTQVSRYVTASSGATYVLVQFYAGATAGNVAYFDDVSIQEVTHAGADGVHIVDSQNGSTRNWASIEAGFAYNDTAYTAEIANVRFSPRGAKIEPIRYSLSRVIDSMKLQVDNLDDALTAAFVDGTPNGSTVTLQMVLFDSNYEMVAAPVTVFEGTIDGWDLDEEKVSLTVASELVRWNQRTLAKHSASCRWKEFKGTECGYAGAETWCDRTYTRCAAMGNQANFGGFRWLPSIVDKEIWWGRNRAI